MFTALVTKKLARRKTALEILKILTGATVSIEKQKGSGEVQAPAKVAEPHEPRIRAGTSTAQTPRLRSPARIIGLRCRPGKCPGAVTYAPRVL